MWIFDKHICVIIFEPNVLSIVNITPILHQVSTNTFQAAAFYPPLSRKHTYIVWFKYNKAKLPWQPLLLLLAATLPKIVYIITTSSDLTKDCVYK
jgi:hypothetical protein